MFFEAAQKYKGTLSNFQPYSPITNRTVWNLLDEEWRQETILLGEQYLHYSYPYISATDFMDFLQTGNRIRYENKCFAKRHALNALILAECVEDSGRFMDDIINGIFSICEESAWQLPPHNSYIRDTPQLILPDLTNPVLDIFSCETGAILGTAYYLLKDKLDNISPFITKRIISELQHRIYIPYTNNHFWWMGNGKEPMNNWTIWCTQNVLLSVFLTPCDNELKQKVFFKACKSTDYFLAEYGEDGCCDEGAQYYRHAGLCLFHVMEILNFITNEHFYTFYKNTKIQNIATYILNAHIEDKYYMNFADCSPVAGRAGCREFLFAIQTDNKAMASFAAQDFIAGSKESLLLPKENNLYYRIQNAFTISMIKTYAASHTETIHHPDIYYPSVGVFIARDTSLYLAVKAGNNADSHNHNDTGSFTIYKNGKPMFIDVGVESYTKKTFSPNRYDIWTMQSDYHNLPTINGQMQRDGETFCAREIHYQITDNLCSIEMDISQTYPKECKLSLYHRKASLIKEKEIVIQDTFSFEENSIHDKDEAPVIINLMTYEKPITQNAQKENIFYIGTLGTLCILGGRLLTIEEFPITDARLQTAWKHEIYRMRFIVTNPEIELHIS